MRLVNMMDLQEFDALVVNTYGRVYSFQQQDDCKDRGVAVFDVPGNADDFPNDTVPEITNHEEMGVSFAAWLTRDPNAPLSSTTEHWCKDMDRVLWWERNFYPNPQMIINDLHARGLLPSGELAIHIDW